MIVKRFEGTSMHYINALFVHTFIHIYIYIYNKYSVCVNTHTHLYYFTGVKYCNIQ